MGRDGEYEDMVDGTGRVRVVYVGMGGGRVGGISENFMFAPVSVFLCFPS